MLKCCCRRCLIAAAAAAVVVQTLAEKDERESTVNQPRLIDFPSLPVKHRMSDGTQMITRNMRHEEVEQFVSALKSDAVHGHGYSCDELSDMNYFMKYYIDGYYNFVVELADTGDVVAYGSFYGPSTFSRTSDPAIVDGGNFTLLPQYRHRGWYNDFMAHALEDPHSNIKGYQGDLAAINLASYFGTLKGNFTVNGCLPRAIYFEDQGWVDILLTFRHRPTTNAKL